MLVSDSATNLALNDMVVSAHERRRDGRLSRPIATSLKPVHGAGGFLLGTRTVLRRIR